MKKLNSLVELNSILYNLGIFQIIDDPEYCYIGIIETSETYIIPYHIYELIKMSSTTPSFSGRHFSSKVGSISDTLTKVSICKLIAEQRNKKFHKIVHD